MARSPPVDEPPDGPCDVTANSVCPTRGTEGGEETRAVVDTTPCNFSSTKKREILKNDVTNLDEVGRLLDSSLDSSWLREPLREERTKDGRSRLLADKSNKKRPVIPQAGFQDRPWPLVCKLPLPDEAEMDAIELETRRLPREAPPGPLAEAWLRRVQQWVWDLELAFRGTTRQVCGSWRELYLHWEQLLSVLPKRRRERVLRLLKRGVGLPWCKAKPKCIRDPKTGGCPSNINLASEKEKVWDTLYEQLVEGAVRPWDCQGGQDVDVLPQGMFPIFWTVKPGSEKVRIIIDLRELNLFLSAYYSTVELPSVQKGRLRHERGDWRVKFDLHSSFYHPEYDEETSKWVGFSIADHELTEDAVKYLQANFPQCRFKDRWVFVYASFAMGSSPSVADFQEIMSAFKDACLTSGTGGALGLRLRQWKGVLYIDDLDAATNGRVEDKYAGLRNDSGFGRCMELGLRLLAALLWTGSHVNFEKSSVLPRRDGAFLGIGHDTVLMRFFLGARRCSKMRRALKALLAVARVGKRLRAKLVARVIGLLWSVETVCHRAVAVMCRSMIRTLAIMLKEPHLLAKTQFNLRRLLKQAWRGCVIWTKEAHEELLFWLSVNWELLWSPMGYDILTAGLRDALLAARPAELSRDVMVVASDASDVAVGGGQFVPIGDGEFACTKRTHWMFKRDTRTSSSCKREFKGIFTTLVAVNPPKGSRVILVVDNMGVWRIIAKGSSIPELQLLAKELFIYCVRKGIVVHPIWFPRETSLIEGCDEDSRWVDNCDFSAPAGLFWAANKLAASIWGSGFTVDRFASARQVQPVNCPWKLPFNSRFYQPFSSGVDALAQHWGGEVNWVNAPYSMIERVYALLKAQRAAAALVVPRGDRRWRHIFRREAEGVAHRWDIEGGDPRCQMVGGVHEVPPSRKGLSVVFLDFRTLATDRRFRSNAGAEKLYRDWVAVGGPVTHWRFHCPSGKWKECPANLELSLPLPHHR